MPARVRTYRPAVSAAPPAATHSLYPNPCTLTPNPYSLKFSFSAKERDTETGLSYFGSRYYSSDLSVWLSVDPMSGKYPSLSPYVYCSNNPIKIIDPNGEDEYDLARDGTLTKRKDGRTDVDIVHATDKDGREVVSQDFAAGSINQGKGSYNYHYTATDESNKPYEKYNTTEYMTFSNTDDAFSFFEFAANYTDVEWAISVSDKEGRVGTAKDEINVGMTRVNGDTEYYHSHNSDNSGDYYISKADFDAGDLLVNQGVKCGIYMSGEKQYYILNPIPKMDGKCGLGAFYTGNKEPARFPTNTIEK